MTIAQSTAEPARITALHAVILAAGVSRRLAQDGPPETHAPKILLNFGGQTLLARHLAILHAAGVARITIVAGFQAVRIYAALPAVPNVQIIDNPDFREGSVVSLHAARTALQSGAPVLLMDGDVLYDRRLMARLLQSPAPDCFLLDRDIEPGDEPVKLCIRDGRIADFRKRPDQPHDWHGESVGFFRFSSQAAAELAARAADYVAAGQRHMEYEEPIRDMILASPPGRFAFEDVTGLPWTEIDFPADVDKARALLPSLAP